MFNIIEFSDELNRVVEDSILLQEYIKNFDELKDKYVELKKEKDRLERELERRKSIDSRELEDVEKKAKSFDEIVEILRSDGVKIRQEMEKREIEYGTQKVGEYVANWVGRIEFERVEEFEKFVEVIVGGVNEMMEKVMRKN